MPITVAQYRTFIEAGGYTEEKWWTPADWKWKGRRNAPLLWDDALRTEPNQPVIGITWYEAVAFCNWLSEAISLPQNYVVRLPTEAEWETAASWDGSQRRSYPWGEAEPTTDLAVYDALKLNAAAPIGCCPAGMAACGALDLVGNVWGWACTLHGTYPEGANSQKEDFTPDDWDVPLRGGSYYQDSTYVRCGARFWSGPGSGGDNYGFRLVVAARLAP